jgi:hypothetical protein
MNFRNCGTIMARGELAVYRRFDQQPVVSWFASHRGGGDLAEAQKSQAEE